jgi:hypothetical protein
MLTITTIPATTPARKTAIALTTMVSAMAGPLPPADGVFRRPHLVAPAWTNTPGRAARPNPIDHVILVIPTFDTIRI